MRTLLVFAFVACVALAEFQFRDTGSCGSSVSYVFDPSTGLFVASGNGPMEKCPDFKFSNEVKNVVVKDGVTSIGDGVFSCFNGMTSAILPDSVTSIGTSSFVNCANLTSVTFGKNLDSIGTSSFENAGLTSVTIPDSVTSIDVAAFMNCKGLSSITIGKSVKSIGAAAFSSDSGLKSLVVPENVKTIGDYTFSHCKKLSSFTYYGLHDIKASKVFFESNLLDFVCVPSGYVDETFCGMPVKRNCNPPGAN